MVSSFEGNEDARFQQEVEQVKQWWQVRRLFPLFGLGMPSSGPSPSPAATTGLTLFA